MTTPNLLELCYLATSGAISSVEIAPDAMNAVRASLETGADVNEVHGDGWSALHCAVMGGQPALVELLLEFGASTDGRFLGQESGTALNLGLFYAKTALCGRLLAAPANPDDLRVAASLGRDLDRFFDESGALTDQASAGLSFYRGNRGFPDWTPTGGRQELLDHALTWSSRNGQVGSMQSLVDRGANINGNPYRGTALLWAIYSDDVEAATWLLDNGADPDLRHDFGGAEHGTQATAMHLAAQYESLGTLRLLLDRGADPTIKDGAFDSTPLGWAEHSGSDASLAILSD